MLRSNIFQSPLIKVALSPLLPHPVPHPMLFKRCCGLATATMASAQPSRSLFTMNRYKIISRVNSSLPATSGAGAGAEIVSMVMRPHVIDRMSSTTVARNGPQQQWQGNVRYMNSDSHDDFGPVKKSIPSDAPEVHDMIQEHITKNSVMLYMKGNPQQPMCGFSATVTKILQSYSIDFSSVNVLDYPSLREGIKTFSNWPTVPQLYINGEFIGGCDIVKTMHENGELKELLQSLPQSSTTTDEK